MSAFRVMAFVCVYNEADILPWTLKHLREQGCEIYVIDNGSTDGSAAIARDFGVEGLEQFPVEGISRWYSWIPLLRRVEVLAAECGATWAMHHDADEIRRPSVRGLTLRDALMLADTRGYTAVDFEVFQFWPTDDLYRGDPERHFPYYERPAVDSRLPHVKAWKHSGRVDLASSGGHEARFRGRVVSPDKLVLKHYPLRTVEQARRKVLVDRVPRYDPAERAMNWHVQYDQLARTKEWIRRPESLSLWAGV
ncbi:MAG: glycosyltransferase family 2 protein [Acidobacteriia bacterium]|nr:glycosyltransferase family 2 protein [Terriglobia bacterium]